MWLQPWAKTEGNNVGWIKSLTVKVCWRFVWQLYYLKMRSLTNLSQVESLCVGLKERIAMYVNGEGDAVLFFLVYAVDILTMNTWSISIQLTGNVFQVTKLKTILNYKHCWEQDTRSTPRECYVKKCCPHRSAFTRSTAALDLNLVLVQEQWKDPL